MAYKSDRPEDFEKLVARHTDAMYRAALAITGSAHDAEDAVQDAFLRACERAPEFESERHERAWLLRVTVNLCRSRLRSPWRSRVFPLTDAYPAPDAERRELVDSVMALPPKYRAVIHLFYYEELSVKEIAELTGRRESTVRSLLTRARQKLRAVLKEEP